MKQEKQPKSLYICYFGVREPLVKTQVIPYLLEVIRDGVDVHLLTFEPEPLSNSEIDNASAALAAKGIVWHHLAYHKRPSVPATVFDILNGARFVRKLDREFRFDVLHCRVHVPAVMGALARKSSSHKPKILFDIRGFFPEEYTDAGIWPEGGWIYRSVKRVERWLHNEADGFVVLTEKARDILFPQSRESGFDAIGRPVEVIPCCVDLERFEVEDSARRELRDELGIGERYVIAYVGSFGGWYLSDEMFDLMAAARDADPTLFVMILTHRDAAMAAERLKRIGFGEADFFVAGVSPAEIPQYLNAADAAVSFIKRCYSKQASSPTKNAEYLASGLSIIANAGVGDVDELIAGDAVGVLIERFDREAYLEAIKRLKGQGNISDHCREIAKKRFDLDAVGGTRYRRLYKRLFCNGDN